MPFLLATKTVPTQSGKKKFRSENDCHLVCHHLGPGPSSRRALRPGAATSTSFLIIIGLMWRVCVGTTQRRDNETMKRRQMINPWKTILNSTIFHENAVACPCPRTMRRKGKKKQRKTKKKKRENPSNPIHANPINNFPKGWTSTPAMKRVMSWSPKASLPKAGRWDFRDQPPHPPNFSCVFLRPGLGEAWGPGPNFKIFETFEKF